MYQPSSETSLKNNLKNFKNLVDLNRTDQRKMSTKDTLIYPKNLFNQFEGPMMNLDQTIRGWNKDSVVGHPNDLKEQKMSDERKENFDKKLRKKFKKINESNKKKLEQNKFKSADHLYGTADSYQLSVLSQKMPNFKIMSLMKRIDDYDEDVVEVTTRRSRKIKNKKKKPKSCEGDQCDESITTEKPYIMTRTTTPPPRDYTPPDILFARGPVIHPDNRTLAIEPPIKSPMPIYAKFLIFIVLFCLIGSIFYLCLRKWFKKFFRSDRTRTSGLAMTGNKLDMKNVQLLGQAYKEKVSSLKFFFFFDKKMLIDLIIRSLK